MAKNLPASARDAGDMGLSPGSERVLGVGSGSPLQDSCLKISMDREAWRATVHGVAELNTTEHTHTNIGVFAINQCRAML